MRLLERIFDRLGNWLEHHAVPKLEARGVEREVIGHDDCPLMLRWTFYDERWSWLPLKAMIHYFPPNVEDKDPHDHPRSFFTFVVKGRYVDTRWEDGREIAEVVHAPTIRYRQAEYMHIVETQSVGCWTLVVMGPLQRPWGFIRDGVWWPFERYVSKFGGTPRCDTDDGDRTWELGKKK